MAEIEKVVPVVPEEGEKKECEVSVNVNASGQSPRTDPVDPCYPGWPGPGWVVIDANDPLDIMADDRIRDKAKAMCEKLGRRSCWFTHRGFDGRSYIVVYRMTDADADENRDKGKTEPGNRVS